MQRLERYPWPGNVRELRNVIERALLLQPGDVVDPSILVAAPETMAPAVASRSDDPDERTLEQVVQEHTLKVWKRCGRNTTQAARALGISLATLKRKLKLYEAEAGN